MKKNRPVIVSVSVGVLLFALLVMVSPNPIDWSLSFSKNDKIPYGNSILYQLLPNLFTNNEIFDSHTQISTYLDDVPIKNYNYIIINNEYLADSIEIQRLLTEVENGNNVFIAANVFSPSLKQNFNLKFNRPNIKTVILNDSITLNFANRKLKSAYGYSYNKILENRHFTSYDSTRTTVLGFNNKGQTTFIKINYGTGNLYLNTSPLAFCNYSLLHNDNYEYIFKSLSYLPNTTTIWDEHYKTGNTIGRSVFEFVLKNTSLKYAWYLFLTTIIIYFLFEAKRRQRVIPIIAPPENTSLKFIETIGRLYFNKKNHLDLAKKKYTYFKEHIRSKYHLNIKELTDEGVNELSLKSGVNIIDIKRTIREGEYFEKRQDMDENELIQFNEKIESFYKQSK